jgi:hypothetical protein
VPSYRLHLRIFICLAAVCLLLPLSGCGKFHSIARHDFVYVSVKHMYLRDRVAVVANRVGEVTNGERLQVVDAGKRFTQVKTPSGAVGWIENHAIIDQAEYDQFASLAKQYADAKPVATAVLYNEMYIHLAPGRKTQRFWLLPANTKVALLERASVPKAGMAALPGLKPIAPSAAPSTASATAAPEPVRHSHRAARDHKADFESQFDSPVPMEDWWLVRAPTGQTGWILSRDLAVDVPDSVAQYAESQKMVGAYVLRTVEDPDSGVPGGKVPEYLTVLTPYKQGLPFDFDQVRVFTWDTHHHRYGTAFRLRDIAGFFPVSVTPAADANGSPEFSIQVAKDNQVSLDPATGVAHANQLETLQFRMEGNLVRRVTPGSHPSAQHGTEHRIVRPRPPFRKHHLRHLHLHPSG